MPSKVGKLQQWWTKVSHFEFWPFTLFYLPVFIYYGYLALKSRSFFFFTASNPSIELGGMMGEKKSDIFELIPPAYIPKTRLFSPDVSVATIEHFLQETGVSFPIIAKPDIGDRGWMVEKISTASALRSYLERVEVDFLVQEYVPYPLELGIFYIRQPDEDLGQVTSIVQKGFLSVTGDGQHTVTQLLQQNVRAMLQADFESAGLQAIGSTIPTVGEKIEIEAIGNHCRGTTFYNAGHWITPELSATIDKVAQQIEGFYFGRFDLRCSSIEDLVAGRNFKILELNGAGAEPGHIYQPGFSLRTAYRDVLWHLKMLQKVSVANKRRGYDYWNFSAGWKKLQEVRQYNQRRSA
ncbi:MAG: hypothetical protein AAGA85_11880 [Bacteroidota bacterium]